MHKGPSTIATFNCKNVKRSIDDIRGLCRTCDLVCLQETWLQIDEIPLIGTIDSGFGYTATSAMDTSAGIVRGRPYGGVALLWRYAAFQQVSVLKCDNPRICAITSDKTIVIMSVYLPTNSSDNVQNFTDCMSAINVIIDESGTDSVFILGDFNADPGELFYNELMSICKEHQWSCVDTEMLGLDSGTFTFISDAHGTTSWLDHCIATHAARHAVVNVDVNYDTRWSDHFPLIIEINLNCIPSKIKSTATC